MAESTGIAWTESSWNPVRGCERVSEGCRKCYAEVLAARHSYPGGWGEGIATMVTRPDGTKEARWTGVIRPMDTMLDTPLRWKRPRRIFVNSMSDLFHKDVPGDFIDAILDTIKAARQHTFQVLTKRPERMLAFMRHYKPIQNLWLGISAEDQDTFNQRVELLGQTPAAKRFVSYEPALGPVDFSKYLEEDWTGDLVNGPYQHWPALDWIIVGGESGQHRRPMEMAWARNAIEQCKLADVPIFVKQDNGPRPGMQGRFTTDEWALKEYPK